MGLESIGDPDPVTAVNAHNLAPRNHPFSDHNFHRFGHRFIQLDDRASGEIRDLFERQRAVTEPKTDQNLHPSQHAQVGGAVLGRRVGRSSRRLGRVRRFGRLGWSGSR